MLPKAAKRRNEFAGAGAGSVTVVGTPSWMDAVPFGRSMVKGTAGEIDTFDQWKVLGPQEPSKPQALLGLYERWAKVTTAWLNGRAMSSSTQFASLLGPCMRNRTWCCETSSSKDERVFGLAPPATSSMQSPPPPF